MLDLSAAFDTVDHGILLSRLSQCIGDQRSAYAWFESYLSNRSQFVQIKDTSSSDRQLTCDLPQGSFVGPNPILGLYVSSRSYPALPGCRPSSWGSRNVRSRSSSSFSQTTVSSMMVGGASSILGCWMAFFLEWARGFVGCVRLRGAGTSSNMLRRLNAAARVRCVYMTPFI